MKVVKHRIKAARAAAKLSQSDVAKAMGISRSAVNQWESANSDNLPTIDKLFEFADVVGCSASSLLSEDATPDGSRFNVPLISWVDAGGGVEAFDPYSRGDGEDTVICPAPHSDQAYALRVRGNSMTTSSGPSYPDGSIIYCDPAKRAAADNGAHVIAYLVESGTTTFKEFTRDEGRVWLKALNSSYPPITEPFEIKAIVIGGQISSPKITD